MNCEAAQAELKAYQDGELGHLDAWRVQRHLAGCNVCAEELRMFGELSALLLSADPVERGGPVPDRSTAVPSARDTTSPARRSRKVQWASFGAALLAAALLAYGMTGRTDALAAAMNAVTQMK